MKGINILAAIAALTGVVSAYPSDTGRPAKRNPNYKRTPVGQVITSCTDKSHVALTFDDGPMDYTIELLSKLAAGGHKATFFMNGNNWGYIYDYASTVAAVAAGGHQIGSHTWTHADLTTITKAGMISEMCQLEVAFLDLIGYVPKAMRPPFLAYNATTLSDLGSLGYRVISIDIDTLDWEYESTSPSTAEQNYVDGYNAGGSLSLNHDVYQNTVETIIPYILNFLATKGKVSVPVAVCLGETIESWTVPTIGAYCGAASSTSAKSSTKTSSSTKSSSSSKSTTSTKSSTTSTSSVKSSTTSTKSSATATSTSSTKSSSTKSTSSASTSSKSSSTKSSSTKSTSSSSAPAKSSTSSSKSSSAAKSSTSSAPATNPTSGPVSTNDQCGPDNGNTVCPTGECCSEYGWCGKKDTYCGTGCQPLFGTCTSKGGSGGTTTPPSGGVSQDGSCGGAAGLSCPGSQCCSSYGWCGRGDAWCGSGCQSVFGNCN